MLEIIKYTAGYANNQYLFDEVSIKISPGEIIGIRGANGCGKSTFIKGLINLTPVKKGDIILNGVKITNWETSKIFQTRQIGYLSQRERIFSGLTVYEHIKLQLEYSKLRNYPNNEIYESLFSVIQDKMYFFASTLSGGEQLVLNLICLLILNPELILLDEPSDSLDININNRLEDLLLWWQLNNKAILLVEQNTALLNKISTKILKI